MSSNRLVNPQRVKALEFQNVGRQRTSLSGSPASNPDLFPADQERSEGRNLDELEREAFQKGFEAGEKSGHKMAERKIEAALKRFAQSLEELGKLRQAMLLKSEHDLVELALEISKKLVHREIKIDEKIIVALVRVALEKLNTGNRVTVYANPLDCRLLEQMLSRDPRTEDGELLFRSKEDLNRGDFLIESDYGQIDGRIAEQFKEIENGLLGSF